MRAHHVADSDRGKIAEPGSAGLRIDGERAAGAITRPEDVGANDKMTVGVYHFALARYARPPLGGGGAGGERMADPHHVGAVCIEAAIGIIRLSQGPAACRRPPIEMAVNNDRPALIRTQSKSLVNYIYKKIL